MSSVGGTKQLKEQMLVFLVESVVGTFFAESSIKNTYEVLEMVDFPLLV